jgi:hypothetical protein
MTHNPEGRGAYLGQEVGDSEGQQWYRAVSRDLAMTSANAREQQRPCSHAVQSTPNAFKNADLRNLSSCALDGFGV